MTALLVLLVIGLIGTWALMLRAHSDHSDALTKMHGDFAAGWRETRKELQKLAAKIDGGAPPK